MSKTTATHSAEKFGSPDNKAVYCRLCFQWINSKTIYWQEHANIHRHRKSIKDLRLSGDPGPLEGHSRQMHCYSCEMLVPRADWKTHLDSENHRLLLEAAALREKALNPESHARFTARKKKRRASSTVRFAEQPVASADTTPTPTPGGSISTVKKPRKRKRKVVEDTSSDESDAMVIVSKEITSPKNAVEGAPIPEKLRRSSRVLVKTERAAETAPVKARPPPSSRGPKSAASSAATSSVKAVEEAIVLSSEDEEDDVANLVRGLASRIPRLVELAPDLDRIFLAGRSQLLKQGGKKISLSEHEEETLHLLVTLAPTLSAHLLNITPKKVVEFAQAVDKAAQGTCASDAAKIRTGLPMLLNHPLKPGATGRGLKDKYFGKLICPIFHDWSKSGDREGLRSGKLQVRGDQYTLGLYKDYKCDQDDLEQGLLQNEGLVSVFHSLFATKPGPQSAGPSKTGGLTTVDMTEVTPRSIAYAACMMRFAAGEKDEWALVDESFDYRHYYFAIIDIFDDSEAAAALLTWWNQRVFGTPGKASLAKSTLCLLKEQRESKRARYA